MSGKALRDLNASSLLERKNDSANKGDIGPEAVYSEIEYIETENLKDLEDADANLITLLERLDSKDWLVVCEALNHVRQLSIFHKEVMLPILGNVVLLTTKSLKNPRSALCKTAIMASSDLIKAFQDQMFDFIDPLFRIIITFAKAFILPKLVMLCIVMQLLQLLLKASQDKRFVCDVAEKALIIMTTCISPNLLLQKLELYVKHKNPRIRAKVSMCICRSVHRLGVEGIKEYGLDALIQIAAAQLNDHLPEAREAARKLSLELRAAYDKYVSNHQTEEMSHPTSNSDAWEQFCCMKLSPGNAQAVLRVTSAAI